MLERRLLISNQVDMIEFTAKKIFLSIFIIIAFYLILRIFIVNETAIDELSCDDFNCWLNKKEMLKKNIAKVCRKYRNSILLPGTALRKMTRFLHFDKGVVKKKENIFLEWGCVV